MPDSLTPSLPHALCRGLRAALFGLLLPATGLADQIERANAAGLTESRAEVRSQARIEGLDDATRAALDEYRQLARRLEALAAYNAQLGRMVSSQEAEMAELEAQIAGIEDTQREIYPLLTRMIDGLEGFVAADRPFLPEERSRRLSQLRELLDRADVSVAEKYRRVLEAYQIENDYGRNLEAYRGPLDTGTGAPRTVDYLRLGRLGLYYQTLDGAESGWWDNAAGAWERLPEAANLPLREGLRMARKQIAPDLLRLPLDAPVSADAVAVQP